MFHAQEFRSFAIDELGEGYREFSTDNLVTLLEQKAKREGWNTNRDICSPGVTPGMVEVENVAPRATSLGTAFGTGGEENSEGR